MDRRTLLGILAGSGSLAVAGCIGVEDSGNGNGNGGSGNGNGDGSGNGSSDDSSSAGSTGGDASFWYALSESELAIVEEAIDDFSGESDYEIDGSDIAELEDRLVSAIPTGEGPEVFNWAHDWVGDFAESGFLSAQTDNIELDLEGTFTEAAAQAVQYDGDIYGVPTAAETVALVYNRDMVDEPPETLEEMQEIMDEYHDPANGMYGLSFPLDPYFYSAFAHTFGGYYFDEEDLSLGLTDDDTIEGFRVILEELDPYMPQDPEYDAQAAVFNEESAPFAINGPWFVGGLEFDHGVTTLPTVDGSQPSPYTGIRMLYFASEMDNDEARASAAREFVEWYATNPELVTDISEAQGFVPVLQEAAESDDLSESVQGYAESADTGIPMPTHPNMNSVWEPVEDAFLNAYTGDQSLEDAMAEAEERIESNWD
ncbi:extracellular solute-binding protein [Natronocalculus amylovorans]|uniref:Extracellular solute-binding protein n=1 Tax=Natronocalculus amylovorans TaxID=2917812 RepID=A0AAE3K7M2_9EURY|nr:extracellular solute-binding protein [Natronocalculus amylovorans]MCL9815605.1 extracellular solute-binding protein [Natronocalculus amylovorans]NUE01882.1 extracellular solute-binding protein [Halorubraceae archaeon YAN]